MRPYTCTGSKDLKGSVTCWYTAPSSTPTTLPGTANTPRSGVSTLPAAACPTSGQAKTLNCVLSTHHNVIWQGFATHSSPVSSSHTHTGCAAEAADTTGAYASQADAWCYGSTAGMVQLQLAAVTLQHDQAFR
jgi:hypothetical protein